MKMEIELTGKVKDSTWLANEFGRKVFFAALEEIKEAQKARILNRMKKANPNLAKNFKVKSLDDIEVVNTSFIAKKINANKDETEIMLSNLIKEGLLNEV